MRTLILAAGVAALAISVPAAAKPERGNGGQRAQAAKVERGGGKVRATQRVERRAKARSAQRFERRDRAVRLAAVQERRSERAQKSREKRAERVQKAREQRAERVQKAREQRAERVQKVREQRVKRAQKVRELRAERREDARERIAFNRDRDRDVIRLNRRDRDVVRVRDRDERRLARIFGDRRVPPAFLHACPPGLAKKTPACVPPGHANGGILGQRLSAAYASKVVPLRLRNIYRDDNRFTYRLGDGYAYRIRRDDQTIAALLPLIGAGLGIGMPFPYSGQNYFVPTSYQSFYPEMRGDDYYRYANGYVYEIDRDTGLIEDMIPLLDRGYGVGQMLPASYSAYNVPYQYRPMYYDTPNYAYRYAPGAIYQVDPTTQLITAVASLLAPGLSIGQTLPSAYSAYNVPLGYRDMYYDTPDAWYRYNNGSIYQVDPTTQLITALVRTII